MSKARHKRDTGGRTNMKVSGNPDVYKEADDMDNAGGKKKGGRVKRATGGGVGAAPAKDIGRMTGGAVKARLDRPGRKAGGRVGANTSPLSTAHGTVSAPSTPGSNANSN